MRLHDNTALYYALRDHKTR
ncbi:MAG: hypothetical protein HC842_02690, partial [Cytophagales bacterium]|nr:hypothetical protein [Cytophagales bacterium]